MLQVDDGLFKFKGQTTFTNQIPEISRYLSVEVAKQLSENTLAKIRFDNPFGDWKMLKENGGIPLLEESEVLDFKALLGNLLGIAGMIQDDLDAQVWVFGMDVATALGALFKWLVF